MACGGPRLEGKTVAAKSFHAAVQCSQAPLEASFTARGAKYGEAIEIRTCGPRGIRVRADIATGTESIRWGRVGDRHIDNRRCTAGREVLAASRPAATSSQGPSATRLQTAGLAPGETRSHQRDFLESSFSGRFCDDGQVTELHLGVLEKGRTIRVKLWSEEPNDVEGARIQIRHRTLWPNVSEKEWARYVAKRDEKWAKEGARMEASVLGSDDRERDEPKGPPPPAKVEVRPRRISAHARWRAGYWHWTHGQWVWIGGQWRDDQSSTALVVPPAPRAELIPERPGAHFVWIPGHWSFNGSAFAWSAGVWRDRR